MGGIWLWLRGGSDGVEPDEWIKGEKGGVYGSECGGYGESGDKGWFGLGLRKARYKAFVVVEGVCGYLRVDVIYRV